MLADVSRYILGRTEGRGLAFGQLIRTYTGKCLKYQSSPIYCLDHPQREVTDHWIDALTGFVVLVAMVVVVVIVVVAE